jgi:hypothetical protein
MPLPQVQNTEHIKKEFSDESLVWETIQQIQKDFTMFGIELRFSGNTEKAYNEIHIQLVGTIEYLIETNYQKLLSVLYQIDVSDKDLEQTAAELPEYTHIEVLGHQIIVRELKKVLTRKYFGDGSKFREIDS